MAITPENAEDKTLVAKNVAAPIIRYYMELIGSSQRHQPIKVTIITYFSFNPWTAVFGQFYWLLFNCWLKRSTRFAQPMLSLIAPGSEATLVTRNLANSLNLKGPPLLVRFGSFWDSLLVASNVVTFKLNSLDGKHTLEASNVLVVSKITLSQRKIDWPSIKTNWEHLSTLDLPSIDSSKVEVLIGMDFPSAHQTLQIAVPIEGEDGPTAHQTCFGWAVVGKIP